VSEVEYLKIKLDLMKPFLTVFLVAIFGLASFITLNIEKSNLFINILSICAIIVIVIIFIVLIIQTLKTLKELKGLVK
jgi:hypothetical protein